MGHNKRKGFTLIEAIMAVAIIAILSAVGAFLMVYLVQNSVFIPNQLNMDMLAKDALEIMIEGDAQTKGLRFSRVITGIPNNNEIIFTNQDNQSIRYRLNAAANKLYRSIAGKPEQNLPYYSAPAGITITGKNSALFNYYDVNETLTNNPADIRRIRITLIAQTGSGLFQDWQGRSEQSSSISVKKFQ